MSIRSQIDYHLHEPGMMDPRDRGPFAVLLTTLIVGSLLGIVLWWLMLSAAFAGPTMLPHPAGCPARAFCACGAAVDVFGKPIRSLWPSSAWFKFPRAAPGRNMVAVRRGHVFVLKQHVQGKIWMVADYNSGRHKSRYHARSIAGYVVVNPFASSVAMVGDTQ